MMRNFYEAVLRLYPAAYRQTFGSEMVETYERAAREARSKGPFRSLAFSAWELAGLTAGVLSEWRAKRDAPESYAIALEGTRKRTDLPPEVAETQRQVDRLIRSMEFAIAHHDFPRARLYSAKEREARKRLDRLLREYHLDLGTAPV